MPFTLCPSSDSRSVFSENGEAIGDEKTLDDDEDEADEDDEDA